MCPGDGLSLAAVEILAETGFKDVKSLKGGPMLDTRKGIPLPWNSIYFILLTRNL